MGVSAQDTAASGGVSAPRAPKRLVTPGRIVAAALAYVLLALVASYAIDVRDAFGLRSSMVTSDMSRPALWYHIFAAQKITEVFQWGLLASAAALAGILGGRLSATGQRDPGVFWSLISVGMAFMLMEDAGNVRDILGNYFVDLFPQYESAITLVFTLVLFGALTAVVVYAAVRYGGSVWPATSSRPYLIVAYAVMLIAALSDVSARVGVYETAGLFVHNTVAQDQLVVFSGHTVVTQAGMFMDSVWEEALELIGYAAFLSAAIAYWNDKFVGFEHVQITKRSAER